LLKKKAAIDNWQHAIRALGVLVCLLGAVVMVVGESILGENHAGIATVIGIVGIGLIAKSSKRVVG
jgi:hypothetical protein